MAASLERTTIIRSAETKTTPHFVPVTPASQIALEVLSPGSRETFSELIMHHRYTWVNVDTFFPLSAFLGELENDSGARRVQYAKDKTSSPGWGIRIPFPFATDGNHYYSISQNSNITIYHRDASEPELIKGDPKLPFVGLRIKGQYLFAFRQDGTILQIDLRTKTVTQIIQTALSKQNPKVLAALDSEFQRGLIPFNLTCIEEGYLIHTYGKNLYILEIIALSSTDENRLIDVHPNFASHIIKIFIHAHKLYVLESRRIAIWDLRNLAQLPSLDAPLKLYSELTDIAIGEHVVLACCPTLLFSPTEQGTIYVWNKRTGQLIHTIPTETGIANKIHLNGNLLICFSSDNSTFSLFDWQTGTLLSQMEARLDPTGKFFAPDLLTDLIDAMHMYSKPVQELPQQPAPGEAGPAHAAPGGCIVS